MDYLQALKHGRDGEKYYNSSIDKMFTEKQIKEVYRDMAYKKEYPDFDIWLIDMLKSGTFEILA